LVQAAHPPKVGDVELLSIICQLGRAATEAAIQHSINERIGRKVSLEWVRHRIDEIETAGLAVARNIQGAPSIRLTALGVERLSGVIHPRSR
jgi:hypothetical protein